MILKNCDGAIPAPGQFTEADQSILSATDSLYVIARAEMDRQAVTKFLDAVWAVIADANRYFAAEEPWAKKKTDPARMATILYVTAEAVRQFAILVQPVMPESAAKLLDLLGVSPDERTFAYLGEKGRLKAGARIPEPQGVFPRYVEPA
jgi:methionyl-tRNA synthetase